jgi:uncharacterized protein (TIGR02246 family)
MKRLVVCSMLVLAGAGLVEVVHARSATQVTPDRSDEESIRAVIQAQSDAFNRQDAVGYLSNCTLDADSVNGRGVWQQGRNDIVRGLSSGFHTTQKDAKNAQLDVHIRFARPDLAIVHVLHEMGPIMQANGQKQPVQKYMSTHVLLKDGGRWMETAVQHTVVQPAAPPSADRDR